MIFYFLRAHVKPEPLASCLALQTLKKDVNMIYVYCNQLYHSEFMNYTLKKTGT